MGLFDYIRFKHPLPLPEYQDRVFQTKDLPAYYMEQYEVREDGSLWHRADDNEQDGSPKFEPISMTGEIRFYTFAEDRGSKGWVEFSCYFIGGKLSSPVTVIEHRTDPSP